MIIHFEYSNYSSSAITWLVVSGSSTKSSERVIKIRDIILRQ